MSENPIYDQVNNPEPEPETETPVISKKARTIAYYVLGISAPIIGATTAIVKIWGEPALSANVDATGIVLISFIGTVAGVFGIAYRPTRK